MGFFSRLFQRRDDKASTLSATSTIADDADEMALDPKEAAAVLAEIDIDTAIAAHENWKLRLQNYLEGRSSEDLRAEVVCLDDRCDLGRWLHGTGRERLGKYTAFSVLVARHKYFHVQASTVVAQAQAGQHEQAAATLNSSYRHASNQVVLLLKSLRHGLQRR